MPYPDSSFSAVVFDPPHLKYTGSKKRAQRVADDEIRTSRQRLERYAKEGVWGVLSGTKTQRTTCIQVERNRHPLVGNTQANRAEARVGPQEWKKE